MPPAPRLVVRGVLVAVELDKIRVSLVVLGRKGIMVETVSYFMGVVEVGRVPPVRTERQQPEMVVLAFKTVFRRVPRNGTLVAVVPVVTTGK